jgi:type II secretory pathway component GspD/PulD (secretin)
VLFFIFTFPSEVISQQNFLDPLEQPLTLTANKMDIERVLEAIATSYRIPISFEASLKPEAVAHKITYEAENKTLREVLNEVLLQMPGYEWSFEEGVINIHPKDASREITQIIINEFFLKDDERSRFEQKIVNLPEVKSGFQKIGFEVKSGKDIVNQTPTLSFERLIPLRRKDSDSSKVNNLILKSVTLKDLLNEMLKQKMAVFWSLSKAGQDMKYVSLNITVFD